MSVRDDDQSAEFRTRVEEAVAQRTPLMIVGGGTKSFLGRKGIGEPLCVAGHSGIINYAPEELVITARAGTPLAAIEALLAEHNQMLPFEPPHFGDGATLGGTIAANLSGPRRAYAGAARDFVLGTRIINGRGQILRLGGEVIKNVAGFDLSRLMAGAMGTLGLMLDVSLKVLPRPREEVTLVQEAVPAEAIRRLCAWAAKPLPITASCVEGGRLYVRLSGTPGTVSKAREAIGGDEVPGGSGFWTDVREQQRPWFADERPLWRLSMPPATPVLEPLGEQFIEWGGALRWLKGDTGAERIRDVLADHGGHAILFRGAEELAERYHPLSDELMNIHKNIKKAIDPYGIFNIGKMYPDW